MSNLPSGAGYKNYVHYGQGMNTGSETFRRYNFGYWGNYETYGQFTAPDYDINAIKFPIAMFGGQNDVLASPKDVAWFHSQM